MKKIACLVVLWTLAIGADRCGGPPPPPACNVTEVAARATVQALYRSLLWRDAGQDAEGFVSCLKTCVCAEAEVRARLEGSEERKLLPQPLTPVVVADGALYEPATGRQSIDLGISLFYAPAVPLERYQRVMDELGRAGVRYARFAGSTFTWGNPLDRPEVNPFRAVYEGYSGPQHEGFTNEPSVEHFAELERRLEYAAARGVRVQYTVFWGGFEPLFNRPGCNPRMDAVLSYARFVGDVMGRHPEHLVEVMNEIDHGHHLGCMALGERQEFTARVIGAMREQCADCVFSVSDGGHGPTEEGRPYFDYHEVSELAYWNVHFPRDEVMAEGIPRWARGVFHLYSDKNEFRRLHGRGGYGRNDENMFLQTEAEHEAWPYRQSTRDWRMYALQLYVSTVAGAGTTLHTQKGFFCDEGLTSDPIFQAVRGWNRWTRDFNFLVSQTFNSSWADSPIPSFDGPFKAFALRADNDILIVVLNPAGSITLRVDVPTTGEWTDPTSGSSVGSFVLEAGTSTVAIPAAPYEHALALRLRPR